MMRILLILLTVWYVNVDDGKTGLADGSLSVDAINDAKIVGGSTTCNNPWVSKALENNSTSRVITVTVEETKKNGIQQPVKRTFVIQNLQPKERRNLGCVGCGQTSTGQSCLSFKVLAAYYTN